MGNFFLLWHFSERLGAFWSRNFMTQRRSCVKLFFSLRLILAPAMAKDLFLNELFDTISW
jgi:hypothetical protein